MIYMVWIIVLSAQIMSLVCAEREEGKGINAFLIGDSTDNRGDSTDNKIFALALTRYIQAHNALKQYTNQNMYTAPVDLIWKILKEVPGANKQIGNHTQARGKNIAYAYTKENKRDFEYLKMIIALEKTPTQWHFNTKFEAVFNNKCSGTLTKTINAFLAFLDTSLAPEPCKQCMQYAEWLIDQVNLTESTIYYVQFLISYAEQRKNNSAISFNCTIDDTKKSMVLSVKESSDTALQYDFFLPSRLVGYLMSRLNKINC